MLISGLKGLTPSSNKGCLLSKEAHGFKLSGHVHPNEPKVDQKTTPGRDIRIS